jgi:hypothetical protein
MTDFLTTLAVRAMGLEVGLRPRPTSIFESVVEPLDVTTSELSLAPPAEHESADAPPTRPAVRAAEARDEPPFAPPRHAQPPPAEDTRQRQRPHHVIERVVEERRVLALQPPAVERPVPPVPPEATVRFTAPPVSKRMIPVEETHEVVTTERREHTVREETLRRDAPTVSSPGRERSPAQGVLAVPRTTRPSPPLVASAAAEAPLTIEVTIGRVEVRAVHPAAPPGRELPARREPSLSLDAYLKQRNRGQS